MAAGRRRGGAGVEPPQRLGRPASGPRRRPARVAGPGCTEDSAARRRPAGPPAQYIPKDERSGVIFVAALNGSALGLGAEFAWACDLRIVADGDFFIGQPEVLLGIMPGGGGSQRLTRLIGTHKSLVAILEGTPFTPAQALANGAVDEVVAPEDVVDAGRRGRRILRQAGEGIG